MILSTQPTEAIKLETHGSNETGDEGKLGRMIERREKIKVIFEILNYFCG